MIENLYPDITPKVNIYNSHITEILPILSLNISPASKDVPVTRSFLKATSFSEYEQKRILIDKLYSEFFPICTYTYSLENLKNDLIKTFGNDSSNNTNGTSQDEILSVSFADILKQSPEIKKNQPVTINDGLRFSIGVKGHFNITFSNIQCGLYAGIYLKAETRVGLSKNIYSYEKSGKSCLLEGSVVPIDINLNLFQIPVFTYGPITIKVSLNGGLRLPFKISASGSVVSSFFFGITGFYAVGFDFAANYGISFTETRFLWFTIKIPTGFYFNPYTKGELISETAFYAGPIDEIKVYSLLEIESAKIEVTVEPYIYIEPRITICDCLYAGVEIGPTIELGIGLKFVSDDVTKYPSSIDIYGVWGIGIDCNLTYGIDIDLKIFHPKAKGKVPIKTPITKVREEYTLLSMPLSK